jgi:hypothetical protein
MKSSGQTPVGVKYSSHQSSINYHLPGSWVLFLRNNRRLSLDEEIPGKVV